MTSEAKKIQELSSQWVAAEAQRDVETAINFFADDAVLHQPGMPQVVGREAIRDCYRKLFQNFPPFVSLTGTPTSIAVAQAGDMAYEVGTTLVVLDLPQGRAEASGKYVNVWKKVGQDWKAVVHIWSGDAAQ